MGSSNKGLFALVGQKGQTFKQLKGKRIAIGQIGDAPYNYTVALLGTIGLGVRDVQWIPVGTDVSGRAAALQTNRADATLLTAMETAGRTLDEKELADAMKETGLGTPATRAAIIEVLLEREYLQRRGKSLEATEKGIRLIQVVHPDVKTPAMTGQWEAWLQRIERPQSESAASPLHEQQT